MEEETQHIGSLAERAFIATKRQAQIALSTPDANICEFRNIPCTAKVCFRRPATRQRQTKKDSADKFGSGSSSW